MSHIFFLAKETSQELHNSFFKKMVDLLSKKRKLQFFDRGEFLYKQDDYSNRIYFINEGRVKIGRYNINGKEQTRDFFSKGEIVGELSFRRNVKQNNFAEVMKETNAFVLSIREFKSILEEKPEFALLLIDVVSARLKGMEEKFDLVVLQTSRNRIVNFLINLVQTKGARLGYEFVVRDFFTHKEIGDMTSTSRQTVTVVLNELKNKNILISNRKRLLVRNMDLLTQELS